MGREVLQRRAWATKYDTKAMEILLWSQAWQKLAKRYQIGRGLGPQKVGVSKHV